MNTSDSSLNKIAAAAAAGLLGGMFVAQLDNTEKTNIPKHALDSEKVEHVSEQEVIRAHSEVLNAGQITSQKQLEKMKVGLEQDVQNIQNSNTEGVGIDTLTTVHSLLEQTEEIVKRLIEAREVLKAAQETESENKFREAIYDVQQALQYQYVVNSKDPVSPLLSFGINPVIVEEKIKEVINEYHATRDYVADKQKEDPDWTIEDGPTVALGDELEQILDIWESIEDKRK